MFKDRYPHLIETDPEVAEAVLNEIRRQESTIDLIASENHASYAVMEAAGTPLTNKYAEGYPGRRYYGGCEYVDVVENIAIERAKKLFGAEHANVQPHSGSQANQAVYMLVLRPGDTIMGLSLAHGGHLTHGHPLNFSGKLFNVVSYELDPEKGVLDYEKIRELAKKHRPKLIISGASAYPRTIDFEAFGEIAREVEAYHMADIAHIAGLVAAKVHPSPVPHADFVTFTTQKTLKGPRGGVVLTRSEYAKDLDKVVMPGIQGGPLMHIIAAKAVAFREAMTEQFRQYARQIIKNAKAMEEVFRKRGIDMVSGGTDNHLILLDLRKLDITGKEAEQLLGEVGIVVNKNAVPNDPRPPLVASGIRVGTPAMTARGMKEEEAQKVASIIADVILERKLEGAKREVEKLTSRFPLYPELL